MGASTGEPADGRNARDYHIHDDTKIFAAPTGKVEVALTALQSHATLLELAGEQLGTMYRVGAEEMVLGRDAHADIPVTDIGVSRRHAAVVQRAGNFYVRDLGSRNGTFVNGERLAGERELDEGDKILVGGVTLFKFTFVDQADEEYQQRLLDAARIDPLSGVLNRRGFEERLEMEIAAQQRHGGSLSLLLLDFDHFKEVNDRHGHQGGDALLKEAVGFLSAELRREDALARLGGDEFAVLVRSTAHAGADVLAERLRARIEASHWSFAKEAGRITVSIGVAELGASSTGARLLDDADGALYRAKSAGRNCVVLAT
jgi:diguanylate cyclase (GGDEF)-like protein